MEKVRDAALSFSQFLRGVWTVLVWAGLVSLVGYMLGFPTHAPPGEIDLTDFAMLGALTAGGRLASNVRRVVQTRVIKFDQQGREFVDAEYEVRA